MKIWIVYKISDELPKNTIKENVGENWEVFGVEVNLSVLKNAEYKGL